MAISHEASQASPWVARWLRAIGENGLVLDLACGSGRHTRLLRDAGYRVLAVDIDTSGIIDLHGHDAVEIITADLEGDPWPFADASFDGVIVTNYLHRPTFSRLLAALKPGGVLIYETFAHGNGEFGRPSNPDFLLRPGELLGLVNGFARVIAYEDGYIDVPKPALVQRICAVKNGGSPRHFPLSVN